MCDGLGSIQDYANDEYDESVKEHGSGHDGSKGDMVLMEMMVLKEMMTLKEATIFVHKMLVMVIL